MGEDYQSGFPQQHLDQGAPNLNSYDASLDLGQQKTVPLYLNSWDDMVSVNGSLAAQQYSKLPQPKIGQPKETCGWFSCLPWFRQGFAPATNTPGGKLLTDSPGNCILPLTDVLREKILAHPPPRYREVATDNVRAARKGFLVFDQSGDQTTLMFSTGYQTLAPCLTTYSPKLPSTYNVNGRLVGATKEINHLSIPVLTDDLGEDHSTDKESEMSEDTEELDALLDSDDESDSTEDDEVASTGHSPSAMMVNDNHDYLCGSFEEVTSCVGSTKKRKAVYGIYEDSQSLEDYASSAECKKFYELDDDAELSFGDGMNLGLDEMEPSGNKIMRMDKVCETLKILQEIIPGTEGKEAIIVLDEAIRHLKSLKIKARALGLASL